MKITSIKALIQRIAVATTVAVMAIIAASCSNKDGWTIEGIIDNGADRTLYIERQSGNTWLIIDSVSVGSGGKFKYIAEEPTDGRSIYALRLGDRRIEFMPEGTGTITVETSAEAFGRNHKLNGNLRSEMFARVDGILNNTVNRVGAAAAVNDSLMLVELGNIIIADTTADVTYYIVTRAINGVNLFQADNLSKTKIRLLGAAANMIKTHHPDDPRGNELESLYKHAKKITGMSSSNGVSMEATLHGRPSVELNRPDAKGNMHDFNRVVDRGGVTILNLTRFDTPVSAANNIALREVYNKYKDQGLEIYQVAFDPNRATWFQSAPGLPWISVYNNPSEDLSVLVAYNADPIQGGPVSFVFDKDGELMARVESPAQLDAAVAKAF